MKLRRNPASSACAGLGIFIAPALKTKLHNPVLECVGNWLLMLYRPRLIIHDRTFSVGATTTQVEAESSVLVRPNDKEVSWQRALGAQRLGVAERRAAPIPDAITASDARYDRVVNGDRAMRQQKRHVGWRQRRL